MSEIFLKPFTIHDLKDFMEWATDDLVTQHLTWNSYTNFKQAQDFFESVVSKHSWFKAISLNEKVIGSITLTQGSGIYACKAELGYVLARNYWGQGFATQAVKLAVIQGFNELSIKRIEAFVEPLNVASQKVLEKNNFFIEGFLKKHVLKKGVIKDHYIYAIYR